MLVAVSNVCDTIECNMQVMHAFCIIHLSVAIHSMLTASKSIELPWHFSAFCCTGDCWGASGTFRPAQESRFETIVVLLVQLQLTQQKLGCYKELQKPLSEQPCFEMVTCSRLILSPGDAVTADLNHAGVVKVDKHTSTSCETKHPLC